MTGKLTLFLTLKIFVYLALDEFTFEHFFLKCLDVVKFEFLELVGDLLGVGDFVFVLNFELGLHLFIVCDHLFFFHFNPLSINLFLNFFFYVQLMIVGLSIRGQRRTSSFLISEL